MSNRVENCIVCPKNSGCVFDDCNIRYLNKTCPDENCDLLENNKLVGLPDYCHLQDREPFNCPIIRERRKIYGESQIC